MINASKSYLRTVLVSVKKLVSKVVLGNAWSVDGENFVSIVLPAICCLILKTVL